MLIERAPLNLSRLFYHISLHFCHMVTADPFASLLGTKHNPISTALWLSSSSVPLGTWLLLWNMDWRHSYNDEHLFHKYQISFLLLCFDALHIHNHFLFQGQVTANLPEDFKQQLNMHSTNAVVAPNGGMVRWTSTTDVCLHLGNDSYVTSAIWLAETTRCILISEVLTRTELFLTT